MQRLSESEMSSPKRERNEEYELADLKASCIPLVLTDSRPPCTFLEENNPLLTDGDVIFQEEGHIYRYAKETPEEAAKHPPIKSVTKVIHHYFHPFDEARMAKRKAHLTDLPPGDDYYDKTEAEVIEMWAMDRALGKEMHYNAECMPNIMAYQHETWEMKMLARFFSQHPYLVPLRTEKILREYEHRIAGSCDLLCKDLRYPGAYYVIDYKRCREIRKEGYCECRRSYLGPGNWKCEEMNGVACTRYGTHPATAKMQDCNFSHYTIQLNLYRWLFELTENMLISGQALLVLNPKQTDYVLHEVPLVPEVIFEILEDRKREVAEFYERLR